VKKINVKPPGTLGLASDWWLKLDINGDDQKTD
jgi:hypothetical protein